MITCQITWGLVELALIVVSTIVIMKNMILVFMGIAIILIN